MSRSARPPGWRHATARHPRGCPPRLRRRRALSVSCAPQTTARTNRRFPSLPSLTGLRKTRGDHTTAGVFCVISAVFFWIRQPHCIGACSSLFVCADTVANHMLTKTAAGRSVHEKAMTSNSTRRLTQMSTARQGPILLAKTLAEQNQAERSERLIPST